MTSSHSTRSAEHADVEFGARIRLRRRELGMSQDELARRASVTFQQVQKYERGTNRVSISRAVQIARALNCRVADLLGDLESDHEPVDITAGVPAGMLMLDGAGPLLTAFSQIDSPQLRRRVLSLVKAMVEDSGEPPPP
ncbi:MAG: helix-turn-helix domain-containing protein [Proteobacteria bacterium]|nr:helix-turn-helix domain-containing protein [Pseudomonadota bacterium]